MVFLQSNKWAQKGPGPKFEPMGPIRLGPLVALFPMLESYSLWALGGLGPLVRLVWGLCWSHSPRRQLYCGSLLVHLPSTRF